MPPARHFITIMGMGDNELLQSGLRQVEVVVRP